MPRTETHVLKRAVDREWSLDLGTLAAGAGAPRAIEIGTVLGRRTIGAATSATKTGGNTGTGTFVLDEATPVLAGAKPGTYTLRCITAVANGGVFRLEDPDGKVLGDVTIPPGSGNSVTVSEQIKGVITDGGTDFLVGDGFDITVAAGSSKMVAVSAAALDGSAVAAGISLVEAAAADGIDAEDVVIFVARGAVVSRDGLIWPAGATDGQKAAWTAQLLALGIVVRATT
jgi:hypothetical protein